jgi:tripartite-type tricarboxylate transporter receptor subunit TctC
MMKSKHRIIFTALFMLTLVMSVPSASFAQHYPDHPIQLVIPNVAGAQVDITGRMMADELEKTLGQKIIPNNKPGAATVLGTDLVVRSKKDGYTLLYGGNSGMTYAPITNPQVVHYDPFKDLEPLGFHYFFPMTITVKSDSPWKTFPELIDYAKKNPGKLRVSTIGVSSVPHFMLEMIQSMTGAQFTHVPFEGGEAVTTAVLGGHVEVTCDGFAKLKPHADAGKLRILLISNKMPAFPEIPTIAEFGYRQNLPAAWFAMYAPSGIPEEVRKVLVPAIEKAVKNTKPKIDQLGSLCEYKSPSEIKKLTEEEYKQIYEVAVKIGLRKP